MSFRRLPSGGSLLLLGVALALLLGRGCDEGSSDDEERLPGEVDALVVRVVDGDTAEMRIGGRSETVRYIGIDTPESVAPGRPVECFGKRSSAFNARLVDGETVRLEFGAERRDRYGRLLAYVYVQAGGRELFVNAEMVRRGYAETLTIAPNDDFAGFLGRLQQAAANAGRGLWSSC